MSGHIQLILGPMFSGKTTELIRRVKRYLVANYTCLIIKYAKDIRYNDKNVLQTHDGYTINAVKTLKLNDLSDIQYDVIAIDEAQFFPDIVEFAETKANEGKIIIVAALDGTFKREGFGDILRLIPLTENIVKLTAVCMICFKEAAFSKRRYSQNDEVEDIGGIEKYISVCRKCYLSDVSN